MTEQLEHPNPPQRRRVLAVASGGGHWVQLQRTQAAFAHHDVAWLTTERGYRNSVGSDRFHVVNDASRWDKVGLVRMLVKIIWIMLRERPHVIITTGAAPGYFALRIGKLMRRRTIWLDSIANVEELSMSGRMAGKYADLWLTQWPALVKPEGPHYAGAVL
ncbi:MAG: UDP-N-acetylglucosamine--LPS N-acetylglucosamine transferase [Phycisphaerales bacterium]